EFRAQAAADSATEGEECNAFGAEIKGFDGRDGPGANSDGAEIKGFDGRDGPGANSDADACAYSNARAGAGWVIRAGDSDNTFGASEGKEFRGVSTEVARQLIRISIASNGPRFFCDQNVASITRKRPD